MAVRRDLFEAAGGFDEVDLPISCSDVDLCLKVGAWGWTVLYAPEIELRHHESLTHGHAQNGAQQHRAETEMAVLLERWGSGPPMIRPEIPNGKREALAFTQCGGL